MRTSGPTIIERIQMKWYNDLRGDLWFGLKIALILIIPALVSCAITLYFRAERMGL